MSERGWVLPIINASAYFLIFVFADLDDTIIQYNSLMTPVRLAYAMWGIVYTLILGFVIYQICNKVARNSNLIQKQLPLPWICHQLLVAAWLVCFSRQMIIASTVVASLRWLCTLILFVSITFNFRQGIYLPYSVEDFLLIEIPFAFLLGWETFTTVESWNVLCVKFCRDIIIKPGGLELAVFMVSLAIYTQAAVFFAGLPILTNPFLHIPLIWGLLCVAYRWILVEENTGDVAKACGLGAFLCACMCSVYFLISLVIMCQTKFCLPELREEASERQENTSPGLSEDVRSAKTAKSSFSLERLI